MAQASSWDTLFIQRSDSIAALEATAEGINWSFSPMVDISRDPRWGRVMEGAGEDTWLGSKISRARVTGLQGADFSHSNTLLACVKHFAAYGAPLAGRDYNTVDISDRTLIEDYLPPYKAAVDAGVATVMTSFNEIAGVPSTANKCLLSTILRDQWHFNGFVVTDYQGIKELIPHGVASDLTQAAELSITAGVDMDMESSAYRDHLAKLIKSGQISKLILDNAVRRILIAKFKLGLFDDPYKYCNNIREKNEIMLPEYLAFAREFVSKTCVLLKNEHHTLPIPSNINSIALIGPLGNSKEDMLGNWSAAGKAESCVTLFEGLKNNIPGNTKISFLKGCEVNGNDKSGFAGAIQLAKNSAYVLLALGEDRIMSGEAASRSNINLPGVQLELAREIIKTGKPTVIVLFNGRPLCIPELEDKAPAILEVWFGGTQSGNGITDVLTGKYNPSAKLTMTFPVNVGQIPIFYNAKNTGRPVDPNQPGYKYASRYIDVQNKPLYPFGFGLSYTEFAYSKIEIVKKVYSKNENITASVNIANTGSYDGEETVQLYVHQKVGDVTRPVKELKGFKKIFLKKGLTEKVTFSLSPNELSYYHQNMKFGFDAGDYELFIGTNSNDCENISFSIK